MNFSCVYDKKTVLIFWPELQWEAVSASRAEMFLKIQLKRHFSFQPGKKQNIFIVLLNIEHNYMYELLAIWV